MGRRTIAGVILGFVGAIGLGELYLKSEKPSERVVLSQATKDFIASGRRVPVPSAPIQFSTASSSPSSPASAVISNPCTDASVQQAIAAIREASDPSVYKLSAFEQALKFSNASVALRQIAQKGFGSCFEGNTPQLQQQFSGETKSNLLRSMRETIGLSKDDSQTLQARWESLQRTGTLLEIARKQGIENQFLYELGFTSDVPARDFKAMTDLIHIELGDLAFTKIGETYHIHPREEIILGLNSVTQDPQKVAELRRYHEIILEANNAMIDTTPGRPQGFHRSLRDQLTQFFDKIDRQASAPVIGPQ